jgi:hypothetical protein
MRNDSVRPSLDVARCAIAAATAAVTSSGTPW